MTNNDIPQNVLNLVGNKYGRLTVIGFDSIVNRASKWRVRCDCGGEKSVLAGSLKSGATKSCGCLDKEKKTKHGRYGTPEYHTWESIKARCHNPKDKCYPRYGGAGILVCDEWLHSFEAFFRDMGEKPSLKHSIDRMNNEKGYSSDNCRWATKREQANNRKNNKPLTFNGISKPIREWAEDFGISHITLRGRLSRGLSAYDALHSPIKGS